MEKDNKRLDRIEKHILDLISKLDKSGFYSYMEYVQDKRTIIKRSFIGGLFRGMGAAIGFSLLGAVIVLILNAVAHSSIPYIADFISEILKIIDSK